MTDIKRIKELFNNPKDIVVINEDDKLVYITTPYSSIYNFQIMKGLGYELKSATATMQGDKPMMFFMFIWVDEKLQWPLPE